MTPDEAMRPFLKIGERLQEQAKSCGLRLATFAIIPDPHGGPHHIQATFMVDDTLPMDEPIDPEFDKIMEDQRKYELEEKAKAAREELAKFREGFEKPGESFLD
jgi:hypothetical protein